MLQAPNLSELPWLIHGFGFRDSVYPAITTVRQIHSDIVAVAGDGTAEADALVTQTPSLLVGVRTADCVSILIADRVTRAVAAVHAGWRGTAARIVEKAVGKLKTDFHSDPADLVAAIGPSIGECCYEVSPDVAHQLGTDAAHVNLAQINQHQLEFTGVRDIWQSGECTRCNPDQYFSYRREKEQAGHMLSFIGSR